MSDSESPDANGSHQVLLIALEPKQPTKEATVNIVRLLFAHRVLAMFAREQLYARTRWQLTAFLARAS